MQDHLHIDAEASANGTLTIDTPPSIPPHPRTIVTTSALGAPCNSRVMSAYWHLQGWIDEARNISLEEDRLRRELEETEVADDNAREEVSRARLALIRAVIATSGSPEPGTDEWFLYLESPYQLRSGNLIFSVVPSLNDGGGQSLSPRNIAEWASLSIVDLDEEPEASNPEPPVALTPTEDSLIFMARQLGDQETKNRLYLAGPYQVIRDAISRLGDDAVAELRRQAQAYAASDESGQTGS